jgi:hypothetical protein
MKPVLRNTYFVADKTDKFTEVSDFAPRPETAHLTYFLKVFEYIEGAGLTSGCVFILASYRNRVLPAYGPEVFVLIHDDEHGRLLHYERDVGAIFKAYGDKPEIARPWHADKLQALLILRYLRSRTLRLRTKLNLLARSSLVGGVPGIPPTLAIPAGYLNQLDLPPIPILDRPFDIGFAGSISNGHPSIYNLFGVLDTPKACSRRQMASVLQQYMEDNPEHKYHVELTKGFVASTSSGPTAFSKDLSNTKICIVPRGCHVETIRYFQSMRYGCVVICENLPDHWFYAGSPAIVVEDWQDLPRHLDRLLGSPELLARKSEEALSWWSNQASERALGRFIGTRVNSRAASIDMVAVAT